MQEENSNWSNYNIKNILGLLAVIIASVGIVFYIKRKSSATSTYSSEKIVIAEKPTLQQ